MSFLRVIYIFLGINIDVILVMFGIPAEYFSAYNLSKKGCVHQMQVHNDNISH